MSRLSSNVEYRSSDLHWKHGKKGAKREAHCGASIPWQLFMAVGFALFFCPAYYAVPHYIYQLWQVAVCAVASVAVLLVLVKNKLTLRWFALIAGCFCYFFVSAAFGDGNMIFNASLFGFCRVVGIASLLEYGLKKNMRKTLLCFMAGSLAMCAVNYFIYILYRDIPGGMLHGYIFYGYRYATVQHWFFFTHDNGTVFYYLPSLSVLWFYVFKYSRKLMPFAIVCSCLVLYMYVTLWSATAMVVTALFLVAMILCANNKARKLFSKLSYQLVVLCGVGFCILVLFLNISGSFDYFASLFGKTGTTDSRAVIWQLSLDWFLSNPITGVGYVDSVYDIMRIGIDHCHNFILQPLYTGGIVSAAFFAWFLALCKPKGEVTAGAAALLVCIFLLFVAQTFDFYLTMSAVFVPFILLAVAGSGDGEATLRNSKNEATNR